MNTLLSADFKGFPHRQKPIEAHDVAAMGWNVLAGDLPWPLAVLKQSALAHNVEWMQRFVRERGIDLAPHGKTTMSSQLFRRQLDAGAWPQWRLDLAALERELGQLLAQAEERLGG